METSKTGLTVAAVIERLKLAFTRCGVADPAGDARILTGGLLGLDLTALVLNAARPVGGDAYDRILAAAQRRCAGEPVHRILGKRGFYGLDLELSAATLEPRPDTETLVEAALPIVWQTAKRKNRCSLLDLGTGSGAICLALLSQIDEATGVATDISAEALQTARANAEQLGLSDRLETVESNWFDAVDGRFDLIVSNPPYIRSSEIATLEAEVRNFDPHCALDGGADGLDAYRAIAGAAGAHMERQGRLVVETGFDQHAAAIAIFGDCGFDCRSRLRDLGGKDRVLVFAPAADA